jgi:hypothetical protein
MGWPLSRYHFRTTAGGWSGAANTVSSVLTGEEGKSQVTDVRSFWQLDPAVRVLGPHPIVIL